MHKFMVVNAGVAMFVAMLSGPGSAASKIESSPAEFRPLPVGTGVGLVWKI